MEENCKRVIETIASQRESHDVEYRALAHNLFIMN